MELVLFFVSDSIDCVPMPSSLWVTTLDSVFLSLEQLIFKRVMLHFLKHISSFVSIFNLILLLVFDEADILNGLVKSDAPENESIESSEYLLAANSFELAAAVSGFW